MTNVTKQINNLIEQKNYLDLKKLIKKKKLYKKINEDRINYYLSYYNALICRKTYNFNHKVLKKLTKEKINGPTILALSELSDEELIKAINTIKENNLKEYTKILKIPTKFKDNIIYECAPFSFSHLGAKAFQSNIINKKTKNFFVKSVPYRIKNKNLTQAQKCWLIDILKEIFESGILDKPCKGKDKPCKRCVNFKKKLKLLFKYKQQ